MTDPISDMIIRIKNAAMAGKDSVSVPHSKVKAAIAGKLKERKYISSVDPRGKKTTKVLELTLGRTEDGGYRFKDVQRVSKPGKRVYVGAGEIRPVKGGTGSLVVSTPKGILFGAEARDAKVGGEALFEIW